MPTLALLKGCSIVLRLETRTLLAIGRISLWDLKVSSSVTKLVLGTSNIESIDSGVQKQFFRGCAFMGPSFRHDGWILRSSC